MSFIEREHLLRSLAASRNRYIHGLRMVPDDRLHWAPGEAPSSLALADRTAGFLSFFTAYAKLRDFPERGEPPAPSASREEAIGRLETAFDGLAEFVRTVPESDLDLPCMAPWGSETPLRQILLFAVYVPGYFQGQANLIQLAYGDASPNIPPDWGREEI